MHRIDTDGNVESRFYDGESTGPDIKPATLIDAAWLNAVQEEVVSVIESVGMQLDKSDPGQLRAAIENKIHYFGCDVVCKEPDDLMKAISAAVGPTRIRVLSDQNIQKVRLPCSDISISCLEGVTLTNTGSEDDYFVHIEDGFRIRNAVIKGFKGGFAMATHDEDSVYRDVVIWEVFLSHPDVVPTAFPIASQENEYWATLVRVRKGA